MLPFGSAEKFIPLPQMEYKSNAAWNTAAQLRLNHHNPDGRERILAQLHNAPAPASFTALYLLHFPIPATNPFVLCELLQQLPEATVYQVGRVEGNGQEGLLHPPLLYAFPLPLLAGTFCSARGS